MIRIFLTGDNHIGLSYSRYGDKAEFLADCRISAFKNMAEKAAQEQCDIFAITGDLFHNNYGVADAEINKLIDYLSAFHGKILILPGNHDYSGDGVNLWRDFDDKANGRIDYIIMTEHKPFKFNIRGESVIIYPACCKTEHSERGKNNLDWIKEFFAKNNNDDLKSAYKIGMAHGSIKGVSIDSDERYFMMTRDELNAVPVDLWLIGHTHVPYPQSLSAEYEIMRENIFNAGSHMQTDVADKNSEGQCFIIELDNSGADGGDKKIIRAKKFLSGPVRFYRIEENMSGQPLENFLNGEFINISDNSIIDLILSGFLRREDFENRREIIKALLIRFEYYKYDERDVMPIIDKEILSEFPENSFVYKFLDNILNDETCGLEEAYMAYSLIKSI